MMLFLFCWFCLLAIKHGVMSRMQGAQTELMMMIMTVTGSVSSIVVTLTNVAMTGISLHLSSF